MRSWRALRWARMASAIPRGGVDGLAIGADYSATTGYSGNFIGSLDSMHLYGSELSPDQICKAAGRSGCASICL